MPRPRRDETGCRSLPDIDVISVQVCSSVAQAADQPYSHVVVTTKAIPELIRTHTLLAPLLSPTYSDMYPQPTYVLFQNGLNVEVDLYDAIKKLGKSEPKIISTAVFIATNLISGNVVEHSHFVRMKHNICYNKLIRNTGPSVTWDLQTGLHSHNQYPC